MLELNRWYNLSISKKADEFAFYIDGMLLGSQFHPPFISESSSGLVIGSSHGGDFLDGLIDELTIYNRALEPSEISAIYNTSSAGLVLRVHAEVGAQTRNNFDQLLYPGSGGASDKSFTTTSDKPSLFVAPPSIDSAGTLKFTPAPNSHGKTRVTVVRHTGAEAEEGDAAGEAAAFEIEIEQRYPWQNDNAWPDTNDDGFVAPNDVLLVIDYINVYGSGEDDANSGGPYYDTSGDGSVSPIDALGVIDLINALGDESKFPLAEIDLDQFEGEGEFLKIGLEMRQQALRPISASPAAADADLLALLANDLSDLSIRRRR